MKGIVFEVNGNKAVVLKNDGGIVEVQAQAGWQTGDVVTLPVRIFGMSAIKAISAIAACFVLLFTSVFALLSITGAQSALISIDVNPSIEFGVNRFGKVVSAQARNDEGTELLESMSFKGLDYLEAITLLMGSDGMEQYLNQDAFLVFSVQANNAQWQEELLANLQSTADTYIFSHHSDAVTEYFLVDGQMVESAHQHGVTAGKYVLLLELESLAPNIDIGEYTHHGVCDIQAEIDTHRHGSDEQGPHHSGGQPTDPPASSESSSDEQSSDSMHEDSSSELPVQEPEPPASQTQPQPQTQPGGEHGGGHE